MKQVFSILFFILTLVQNGRAQDDLTNSYELNARDGVPSSFVNSGFQDQDGFIWSSFGNGSLVRYDGKEIRTYTNSSIRIGGKVNIIPVDEDYIWIVSRTLGEQFFSIIVFKKSTETFTSFVNHIDAPLSFPVDKMTGVFKNADETIWITSKEGIFEYRDKGLTLWSKKILPSLSNVQKLSDTLFCQVSNSSGGANIQYWNSNEQLLKEYQTEIVPYDIHFIPIVKTNNQKNQQTYIHLAFTITEHVLVKTSFDKPFEIVDRANDTPHGTYGADGTHIFKTLPKRFFIYDDEMNLEKKWDIQPGMVPYFSDNQDGIWFSKGRGKVVRMYSSPKKFQVYQNVKMDRWWYGSARGIVETEKNELFISFNNTVNHILKDGTVETIRPASYQLKETDYFGMELQRDNQTLWIIEGFMVFRMNIATKEYENIPRDERVGIFWKPYEDKKGIVWFGGSNGLHYYDKNEGRIKKYLDDNGFTSLRSSSVLAFHENSRGIWISTSKGIFLLDRNNGIIEHYHTNGNGKFKLPFNSITHLQEDQDGTFWIASKGGGLIHYFPKTGKFEQFSTGNNLKDDVLYACHLDEYGQVWLPSNNGLMRFDKKTHEVIHYTESDGVPHVEFNTISHYKGKDGRLYFGGLEGVVSFHPKDMIPENEDRSIKITRFQKTNSRNVLYHNSTTGLIRKNEITLLPSDKMITLRFVLSSLKDPKNHTYQYKIQGLNSKWFTVNEPEITLNNLPYGNYEILIRAKSTGRNWKYYSSPIVLIVKKPFYFQWWFIALVIFVIILIVYLVIKRQTSRLRRRKDELESIVTERTAEIVSQAEELKTLDKMKSQFFANISHELRTPLTLILGPVNALQEESSTKVGDKKLKKNLDVIERNAENLLGIVDEVLELSKLNAGKVKLSEDDVILKDYLKRIISSFESTAELRKIKFRFIYHPSIKLNLRIDQKKLEKIINNLLSNAFKFTPDEGEIQLEITEKTSTLLISVSDTGSGIDEEDLPFIFDRFYQSKAPKFTAHGGTGIGLALCYEMIKLMKGTIWAESTIEVGSRFFVEIPKKTSGQANIIEKEQLKKNLPKTETEWSSINKANTILIVEDNSDMREYVRSLLRGDHTILLAENGQKGLDIIESKGKEIDLVISDVMMPVMDGFTMLEQLKEHDKWRNIPVIMLTARAAEEDKLHALTIGVDDYLTKPFSTAELQARVKNLLENYQNRKAWQHDIIKIESNEKQSTAEVPANESIETATISKQDLNWIKQVETIISENIANEKFDIESLAEQMFLSKRQFERKIKKITGLSPAKIVLEVRLQQARDYLEKDTYQTVSEVSYAIGIQTPSYFSNVYSKRFGKRPSSYFL